MVTEIFVENRRLDLSADISSLLTFAIDDVKNFASRQTTFSKTVVLPGTANNNQIFGHIFEVGISNQYDSTLTNIGYNFNPSKSARCIIFQDYLQTFKGTIRMLEIVKEKGRIEYEMALNGEITGLNVALSSGLLSDLDFSAYNQALTTANIIASWDNTPGSGVYFPLIDYGTYSTDKHNWDIRTFRPALYVKEYIDKMFTASGYRYICDLFDTARFKKIVVPHNQKKLTKLGTTLLSATISTYTGYVFDEFGSPGLEQFYPAWDTISGTDFVGSAGNTIIQYTGADTIAPTITVGGYLALTFVSGTTGVYFELVHEGFGSAQTVLAVTTYETITEGDFLFENVPVTLHTNDLLFIRVRALDGYNNPLEFSGTFTDSYMTITSAGITTVNVNPGDMISLNDALPKNIRQVDFLLSIVRLFNLYVYESQWDERLILIAPFVDFYDGSAVDWTYKLNRDQPIRIRPMSELNSKIYEFRYRDDNDYYNELYRKRYNKGYGAHIFDSEFEFASQTNKLELIFAPTPMVGYVGEDKVYSTIFKRTGTDAAPVEETIDSVIRILQTKKKMSVTSWDIKDGATIMASVTDYGYAGHLDDPNNPDNDLNFGVPEELFFEITTGDLSKTQFNLYWSSYMYEITDKDSKLLIGKFYLTPMDIFNLRFQSYVFVDGVLWRLNKIVDYNVSEPSECTVELLKVVNTVYGFPPDTIPPSTPSNFLEWQTGDPVLYDDTNEIEYN